MRRNEYSQVFTSIKSSKVNSSEVTGSCSTKRVKKESERKRYFEALIVDDDELLLPFCSILIRCVSLCLCLSIFCATHLVAIISQVFVNEILLVHSASLFVDDWILSCFSRN